MDHSRPSSPHPRPFASHPFAHGNPGLPPNGVDIKETQRGSRHGATLRSRTLHLYLPLSSRHHRRSRPHNGQGSMPVFACALACSPATRSEAAHTVDTGVPVSPTNTDSAFMLAVAMGNPAPPPPRSRHPTDCMHIHHHRPAHRSAPTPRCAVGQESPPPPTLSPPVRPAPSTDGAHLFRPHISTLSPPFEPHAAIGIAICIDTSFTHPEDDDRADGILDLCAG